MLLKIYQDVRLDSDTYGYNHEELHIIDRAENVIVHQGNYGLPELPESSVNIPRNLQHLCNSSTWGPTPANPLYREIGAYCEDSPEITVRVIDYMRDGNSHRALVQKLCYVCTDFGKTIEKVESYSGGKLSI